jgi:gamma-glutamylcyclotransferase (GGCT)/AIG2-like uncharacterized protein YtfP
MTGERVFVYGTLRSGASNAWRMAGGKLLGNGSVRGRLYRVSWYPALVLDETAGSVCGEVHEVTPEMLEALDLFEGISATDHSGEYRRVPAKVTTADGETISAWVWEWVADVTALEAIAHGDWLAV